MYVYVCECVFVSALAFTIDQEVYVSCAYIFCSCPDLRYTFCQSVLQWQLAMTEWDFSKVDCHYTVEVGWQTSGQHHSTPCQHPGGHHWWSGHSQFSSQVHSLGAPLSTVPQAHWANRSEPAGRMGAVHPHWERGDFSCQRLWCREAVSQSILKSLPITQYCHKLNLSFKKLVTFHKEKIVSYGTKPKNHLERSPHFIFTQVQTKTGLTT